MNSCKPIFFVCVAVLALAVPSLAVIPIKGNSSHGFGDGIGSWNETGNFLGVTTTSLAYNTLFPAGQQASDVYSLGNGIYEQVDCNGGGTCDVGGGTTVEFAFQVPVSQIQNGMVTFSNFTGSISTLEVESCASPTKFNGNLGPGFLCTTYPKGTGSLNVNACQTGTTLTFTLTGSYSTLPSITFLMEDPNTDSTLTAPALSSQPATCATQPPVLVDFVAAAIPVASTPCKNCVNGSTAGTIGLAAPLVFIPHNTPTLQLLLYYHDNGYYGDCKLTFTIAQSGTVLTTTSSTFSGFQQNQTGAVTLSVTPPIASGAAVLKGSLKCGTYSIGITGPLYFQ